LLAEGIDQSMMEDQEMLKKTLLTLSVTCALSAVSSNTADAQADLGLKARARTTTFLHPLELTLVLRAGDPRLPQFCAPSGPVSCPPIVSSVGIPGGVGMPDDWGNNYRNVRVSFYVTAISNEIVANGGVEVERLVLLRWLTSSPAADVQHSGPFDFIVPAPGESLSDLGMYPGNGNPSGLLIYDALVFDACGAFASFPVDHEATVLETAPEESLGSFMGTDNSTIDSTGYYNLSYRIRAESDGGVSDFHIEGKVAAICSGQNSL
jgi:hypothetical protein